MPSAFAPSRSRRRPTTGTAPTPWNPNNANRPIAGANNRCNTLKNIDIPHCDLSHFTISPGRRTFPLTNADMGKTAMHPLENTTRFFAVVGAPYIPEGHRGDCCDDTTRHFAAAESE